MSETPAAPGWYQDPDDADQLRYFDGVVWSAHTTPRVSTSAHRSTIGHAVPTPPSTGRTGHGTPPPWAGQNPPAGGSGGPAGSSGGAPSGSSGGSPYGSTWAPYASRTDVLPDGAVLAEWWRRLLARIIDWLISSVLGLLVAIPWLGPALDITERALRDLTTAASSGAQPDFSGLSLELAQALLPVTMVGLVVKLVYEIAFLAWKSATPGKMVVGTVVRRVGDGEPIGLVTAVRRQVVGVLASAIAFVPYLGLMSTVISVLDPAWLLWDPKRQTLHDKVADTVVVLRR